MTSESKKEAKQFAEVIGRALAFLINKSVLNHKAIKELKEILGRFSLSNDALEDIIKAIQGTVLQLIESAPYLSCDQTDALVTDLGKIFRKVADISLEDIEDTDSKDAIDPVEFFEEKCEEIKTEITGSDFSFKLVKVPVDVLYEADIRPVVEGVIGDNFSNIVDKLPSDDRIRLFIKIEQTTESNINRFCN